MFAPSFKKSAALWSAEVTESSHAMDLEPGVFKKDSPKAIAKSVRRSAEHSDTLKSTPFRSAMSMINFYQNRAGKNLPKKRHKVLDQAKAELRKLYKKDHR